MKKLICAVTVLAVSTAQAATVAHEGFSNPSLANTILADAGHVPTALTAANIEAGALTAGTFDVFVISRNTTFFGASQQYVDQVGAYVAAGGNIVTEFSGVGPFFSAYDEDIRPGVDGTPQLGLFDATLHAGWNHGSSTPVTLLDPGHPTVAGLPNPFAEGSGTEFFYWIESNDPNLTLLAEFTSNGTPGFPPAGQDLPCLAVGDLNGSRFVFGVWCWNDTLSQDGFNRQFFLNAVDFAAEGAAACFLVFDEEIVCSPDGSSFTYTVHGTDSCTGGMSSYDFTASGGAVGEELCFTLLVDDGGFCCTTEICVTIPDCTPAAGGILWDDSHDTNGDELSGNYSVFAAALTGAGHVIAELDGAPGAITPAALSGFNAFFLMDPELALTGAEITTLQGFVAGGGGLFVAWDGGAETTSLNTMLTPYGLSFSGANDVGGGTVISNFVSHPVTAGLSSFEFGAGAFVGTTGSAIDLSAAADPDILAVSGGTDRVVAIGDASMFKDTLIGDLDNELLAINIANYMLAPQELPCDLNGDGVVDMQDFLALFAAWGSCSDCGTCPADFDGNCSVGILDLLMLLGNWTA